MCCFNESLIWLKNFGPIKLRKKKKQEKSWKSPEFFLDCWCSTPLAGCNKFGGFFVLRSWILCKKISETVKLLTTMSFLFVDKMSLHIQETTLLVHDVTMMTSLTAMTMIASQKHFWTTLGGSIWQGHLNQATGWWRCDICFKFQVFITLTTFFGIEHQIQ